MNRSIKPSRITDEMYARIPALLEQGTTTTDIATMYGVTLGTLKVFCSQRGISLRKGGARPPRAKLVLQYWSRIISSIGVPSAAMPRE